MCDKQLSLIPLCRKCCRKSVGCCCSQVLYCDTSASTLLQGRHHNTQTSNKVTDMFGSIFTPLHLKGRLSYFCKHSSLSLIMSVESLHIFLPANPSLPHDVRLTQKSRLIMFSSLLKMCLAQFGVAVFAINQIQRSLESKSSKCLALTAS